MNCLPGALIYYSTHCLCLQLKLDMLYFLLFPSRQVTLLQVYCNLPHVPPLISHQIVLCLPKSAGTHFSCVYTSLSAFINLPDDPAPRTQQPARRWCCHISQEPAAARPNYMIIGWHAMREEYDALMNNQTWSPIPYSPSMNIVGCKWVCKVKRKADGSLDQHKARLVAKGLINKKAWTMKKPVVLLSNLPQSALAFPWLYLWYGLSNNSTCTKHFLMESSKSEATT